MAMKVRASCTVYRSEDARLDIKDQILEGVFRGIDNVVGISTVKYNRSDFFVG